MSTLPLPFGYDAVPMSAESIVTDRHNRARASRPRECRHIDVGDVISSAKIPLSLKNERSGVHWQPAAY